MEGILWLVISALTIIPMLKLLPHFGINKNWAFACIISPVVIVLLWMMAMKLQEMERR